MFKENLNLFIVIQYPIVDRCKVKRTQKFYKHSWEHACELKNHSAHRSNILTHLSSTMTEQEAKIDTTGTTITTTPDGRTQITLDKRVTNRAFKEVLEYLYTDKVRYVLLIIMTFLIDSNANSVGIRTLILT
jgi:hypothetical protein